jgi:nitrate/nitrite-specific signal transduction histidine kinase
MRGHFYSMMAERAKQINYTASIHSEKGQGTTIVVTQK